MQIKKAAIGYNIFFSLIQQSVGVCFLFFILSGSTVFAQSNQSVEIQLNPQLVKLDHTSSYYILDVEEGRSMPFGKQLGNIVENRQPSKLALNAPVEKVLYNFWSRSTPRRDSLSVPVVIKINELKFSESLSDNSVKGTLDITLQFYWHRQQTPIQLVQYKAQQVYTRSLNIQTDYESILKNSLIHALKYFDKWVAENEGKNPAMARGISIKFADRSSKANSDTIFYNPDKPLKWADFRGTTPNRSRYAASIFTSFAYEGNAVFKGLFLEVTLTFSVFMVKDMSWKKAEANNAYSLAHEQLHFDIVQVIVNRFKNHLLTTELSIEDYDSQIQYQFIEFFRKMNKLQKSYDDETNHGLNSVAQSEWQESIKKELANP